MCNLLSIFTGRGRKRTGTSPARAVERVATPKPIKIRMSQPKPEPEAAPTIAEVAETTKPEIEPRPSPRGMASTWAAYGDTIREQAGGLGIDPAVALAVLHVEAGRIGFRDAETGRATIRFENHIFYRRWGRDNQSVFDRHFKFRRGDGKANEWKDHKFRPSDTGPWGTFHGNQDKEWAVYEFAAKLDPEAAAASTSIGGFQIMGFNYENADDDDLDAESAKFALCDYGSAKELVDAFQASDRAQIRGFFAFVRNTGLGDSLRKSHWRRFAAGYNGASRVDSYAPAIAGAVVEARKVIG